MYAMQALMFFLSWIIKIFRCFLFAIIISFVLYWLLYVLLLHDEIFYALKNLNISFYINKYNLMPIISGILSGFITLISMLYINNLNKKIAYNQKLAEKEIELKSKYYETLEDMYNSLEGFNLMNSRFSKFFVHGEVDEFIDNLYYKAASLSEAFTELEIYYHLIYMDRYMEKLIKYNDLKHIFICMMNLNNGKKLKIEYHGRGKNKTFNISNLPDIIPHGTRYSYEELYKFLQREILSKRKFYNRFK